MFAEVMVNLANRRLDKVFHYSVPLSLQQRVKEGMQVLVPFGPRVVDGYIVGFAKTAEVDKTKDILDIADDEPVFDKDMLSLARWMAKEYLCSLVEALHVVMPPGRKLKNKKHIFINTEVISEILEKFCLDEKYTSITKVIIEAGGNAEYNNLEKVYGKKTVDNFIKTIREQGVGGTTRQFSTDVKKKKVKQVFLAESADDIDVVLGKLKKSRAMKQAEAFKFIAEEAPISLSDLKECGYGYSIVKGLADKGLVVVEETEEFRNPFGEVSPPEYKRPTLTDEQRKALDKINDAIAEERSEIFLIHGVTGSGKTEVYLQAIEKTLEKGKQAICLVPEISLTPQMVGRFRGRFRDEVAVLHSALSIGERYDQWRKIRDGKVRVAIGARSAVFAPVPTLGLIILDEEHEATYKQEDNPKYHAREVAIYRAGEAKCPVLLGSATPSAESYYKAETGEFRLLNMPHRIDDRPMPPVEIVDLREEMEAGNRSIFSRKLSEGITNILNRNEQAILFLNRRGFSTFVVCRDCGYVVKCTNCDVTMTYHAFGNKMVCHYCDYTSTSPQICPTCGSKYIRYFGLGTQKVEDEIKKHFPQAKVLRMDVDTTGRKGAHEKILTSFAKGEADILIGTQMIAKGLDFPKVTLVGVITADTSLNLPDFRSGERTFQLLTQVAGRAGRDKLPGTVVVQSYNPDHFSIQAAREHDYLEFYRREIDDRRTLEYPPFCQLLRIVVSGFDENRVIQAVHTLAENMQFEIRGFNMGLAEPLLGPAPAPLTKVRNRYRWQLCIKAEERSIFSKLLENTLFKTGIREQFSDIRFNIEIDPQSLL